MISRIDGRIGKEVRWVGSSLKDLSAMPEAVQDSIGSALRNIQFGDMPENVRSFGEGLDRAVLKLVDDHAGDTYRVAFSVAFHRCIYVLHAFRKKSTSGRATPTRDLNVIKARLKAARADSRQSPDGMR